MLKKLLSVFLLFIIIFSTNCYADDIEWDENGNVWEEIKDVDVSNKNEIPKLNSKAAIIFDRTSKTVIYGKNINDKRAMASTTKIMTSLLVLENGDLNKEIEVCKKAAGTGGSRLGLKTGDKLKLKDLLYGLLLRSGNDAAVQIAIEIGGSIEGFAELMNEKAKKLNLNNTHFVTPHGLDNENHYTTAHDLALIAKAFFQNEQLSKIGNTGTYHFQATVAQPDDFIVRNKHQLISGEIAYEGIKGGKTGYTDEARQTLVTCAERNDMKLICVILKEESPNQFYDTVKLFDYGFTNFSVVNVAEHETKYSIESSSFFHTSTDIFGNSQQVLTLNQDSYLIMPKTVTFEDLDSKVSYDTKSDSEIAIINYYYHGAFVGAATVNLLSPDTSSNGFTYKDSSEEATDASQQEPLVINVKYVLVIMLALGLLIILISFIHSFVINYSFFDNVRRYRNSRKTRRKMKKGPHF